MDGLKYGSCRFWPRTDLPPGSNKFRMVYANAAGRISWRSNMHGLKYGSCRFGKSNSRSNVFQIRRSSVCVPAVGKFSRASSAGGRRHLRLNFVNQIVSVAEDCLSPERTFHGCPLMHGLKSGSCRFWQRTDLPPGSNMLRRAAQTCSACKLAGVQIIPLPT